GGKTDENREMASNYGISPVQIRIMENDEVKFKNAYMGLVLIHGDLIERLPAITSTDGLEFQLTTAIQKMNNKVSALLRLDEKIKVTLYQSSGLNAIAPIIGLDQLPNLTPSIGKKIQELNRQNFNALDYEFKDVNDPDQLNALAKEHNLLALSWPAIPQRKIAKGVGTAGIVISHKGQSRALPLISAVELPLIGTTYQMADPEVVGEELTTIMEKMIGINKDIGYLSDHGSQIMGMDRMAMMQGRSGGGMRTLDQLLSKRYDIKKIPVKTDAIPEGLNCLIIAKPTEKFSDYELFQIDQALMKGTNLAVFSDAFTEENSPNAMGMPKFTPIDSGLEKLLAHYGIKIEPAYVMDKNAYKHARPQSQGGGEQPIYFAPMLKEASINTEPAFMKNIKGLVTMQVSPLSLNEEQIKAQRIKATKLLSSSKESWLMEGMINLNPMFITPPKVEEAFSSQALAYLLEGEFSSYFADKPIPKKEMGEADLKEKKKKGALPSNI
ncbi:MAG: GldG family protein, partial [Desulfovibrionales bacterium]|nr:GldG family protein [Desulfovibrionales bacterium]